MAYTIVHGAGCTLMSSDLEETTRWRGHWYANKLSNANMPTLWGPKGVTERGRGLQTGAWHMTMTTLGPGHATEVPFTRTHRTTFERLVNFRLKANGSVPNSRRWTLSAERKAKREKPRDSFPRCDTWSKLFHWQGWPQHKSLTNTHAAGWLNRHDGCSLWKIERKLCHKNSKTIRMHKSWLSGWYFYSSEISCNKRFILFNSRKVSLDLSADEALAIFKSYFIAWNDFFDTF